ncbi:MAG: hypothetical protein KME20_00455 [Kaiparowitsia implicata GSE-PSE-MK54-09C]|nr:hypothetical protein [Kaiparowitsia implicata GSE-PSE-MK54-09C]
MVATSQALIRWKQVWALALMQGAIAHRPPFLPPCQAAKSSSASSSYVLPPVAKDSQTREWI